MAARTVPRSRVREGAQVWRDRVDRWKQSGKTASEFARSEGIRPERLAWWKWHLQHRRPALQVEVAAPTLLPVHVLDAGSTPESAPAPAASPIELLLAGGRVVVRIGPEFDERTLRRVVDALGGA